MSEFNPLVQRVDALLKRHHQQGATVPPADPDTTLVMSPLLDEQREAPVDHEPPVEAAPPSLPEVSPLAVEDDFPVLTEVVDDPALAEQAARDPVLAKQVEAAVLERVLSGLEVAIDHRMGRTVSDLLEQAMDGLRADLSAGMRELVREAVATAVREELASRSRQD